MPIVSNAANSIALQNAANLESGLTSIGQALNNPQAWANADLLRAHKALTEAQTQKTLNDIGLGTKLNEANVGYLTAHTGQANASADLLKQRLASGDPAAVAFAIQTMHPELSPQQATALATLGTAGASGTGENPHLMSGINQGLGSSLITSNPNGTEDQMRRAYALMNGGQLPNENTAITTQQQATVPQLKPMAINPWEQVVVTPSQAAAPQGVGSALQPQASAQPSAPQGVGSALQAGAPSTMGAPGVISFGARMAPPANPYVPFTRQDPKLERQALNDFVKNSKVGAIMQNIQNLHEMQDLINQNPDLPLGALLGNLSHMTGNYFSPAAQQFNKLSAGLQLGGGGLGALAGGGQITDAKLAMAGQATPGQGLSRQANQAILQTQLAQNEQALQAYNFLQKFVDNGGSIEQGRRILSEYALDPSSQSSTKGPDGTLILNPTMTPDQFYQAKLNGFVPGQQASAVPVSTVPQSASAAAVQPQSAPSFVVGKKYSSNGIVKTYAGKDPSGNDIWQ